VTVMQKSTINRRSWVTQRLANHFPPLSRARNFRQSMAQQVLQPPAREMEEVYYWSNYNRGETLLNTIDLQQYQGIHRVVLGPEFRWGTREDADSVVYTEPRLVRARLEGDTWVTLAMAEENGMEEFWFGLPSRITAREEALEHSNILEVTPVADLSTAMISDIQLPGKLWVSLSNNSKSLHYYGTRVARSVVKLYGRDAHGRDLEERVTFVFNGTLMTRHDWSDIDSVATEYIDDQALVSIDWLPTGSFEITDPSGVEIRPATSERIRFFALGAKTFGSTLQHKYFAAPSLLDVEDGQDEKDIAREMKLLDTDENPINAVWLSSWPKRKWLIAVEPTRLHFFHPEPALSDFSLLVERTPETILQIATDKEEKTEGDYVTIDYHLTRPFWTILRTRWSVIKPDGNRYCLADDGSEIAFGEGGWKDNENHQYFNRTGVQRQEMQYLLDQSGDFVFCLESRIKDAMVSSTDFVDQTDLRVITAHQNKAIISLDIPPELGTIDGLYFDSYQNPWVSLLGGTFRRISFHYDKYIADYSINSIYVREPYLEVEVEA